MHVACVGDRFITGASLEEAAREAFGADIETVSLQSEWPDVPFGPQEGVRESSGDPAQVAALAADADVLLTHLGPVTASVLDTAGRLRVVGVTRGGPVNVDLDAATAAGVPVIYLPGRNLEAAAEFTIGLMIALPRGIGAGSRALAAGVWDASYFRRDVTGPELGSATVGLVGGGAIGRRVGVLASAFGARVLVFDPYADAAALRSAGLEPAPLDTVLGESDIVGLHARVTDETRGMVDAAFLAAMRPGAYFVNSARGEFVDHKALLAALDSGQLAGAALDVFDPEPPAPDDPLINHPRVLATPHLAGSSREVAVQSGRRVAAEAANFVRTGELAHCANPDWREHVDDA